jgi:hypothetical protein
MFAQYYTGKLVNGFKRNDSSSFCCFVSYMYKRISKYGNYKFLKENILRLGEGGGLESTKVKI